ncbi:hypothetical protein Taro_046821 [Colocasia esculenta]|uniref:Uncharacterized protein n=1 Tax=Colocasia esculenta TaxID=4460 RepID=A0A843X6K7_COLES|nr:hypothetical protein [Colocasia esculenta]
MVYGGRSGRVSTSVGRGSASPSTPVVPATGTASPSTPVIPATGTTSPSTPVVPATGTASPIPPIASPFPSQSPPDVGSQHPAADEEGPQLLGRQPCWISGGKIDPGSASRYITTLVHAHIPGPVDSWKEFPPSVRELLFDMFTCHKLERAPTFRELFDRTHKWKGTDDYISESARTIVETYDRTMTDRYA